MEFIVKQQDLLAELAAVSGAVKERTTIPILAHALVTTGGDAISITATDMELMIQTRCPAQIKTPGTGTVPLSKLLALTKLLPPDGLIQFTLADNRWFGVKNGERKYKVPGFDVANYPSVPTPPGNALKLPGAVLAKLIARVTFAVSDDEGRYTLSGALMVLTKHGIRFVATDSHRMAVADSPATLAGLSEPEQKILVPKRAMVELAKLLGNATEDTLVEFSKTNNHLFFSVDQRTICARLLTGQFPNYEVVLPKDNDKKVSALCDEFIAVLKRVSEFSDDRTSAVKISLMPNAIGFSSQSPEYGEAFEQIAAAYDGEEMAIGFNGRYLLDFLAAAPPGSINMKAKEPGVAVEFSPANGDPYRYIVMPMNIAK